MKKIIISIIVLLGIMMPRIAIAQDTDPEPYAVLSEGNTVLTFYYDKQKETRSGMDLTYTPWRADETKGTITKVVFDASFADCTTLTTTDSWFNECSSLVTIENISNLKTENVTNMSAMFRNCTSLTSIDFESFNTSRATTLDNMFFGCTGLTSLDLSSFNTARVEDMHSMFAGCTQLTTLDLSHFDTSSLTNIQGMFSGCEKLDTVDLSSWKPTQVTDIRYMFYYCTNLTTVYVGPKWNLSSVTDNGTDVFTNCINIVGGKGTKYSTLYTDYTYAHIDRGTSYPGYFRGHPEPYVDYDNTVLTFYYDDQKDYHDGLSIVPFGNNPPLWSEYCYNGIKTVVFDESFANCTTLTSTSNWFYNCNKLTTIKNIQNLKTDNVEDMQMMFWRCSSLTNIDLSNFNTENVTNMRSMFEGCTMLESIDVSGFNTGKVTDMHAMFYQCSSLKRINASNFNTENVTSIQSMFGECTNLRSIDISSFKTDKVTNMIGAFYESPNLTTIYVGNGWSTASVTDSQNMFLNCTSLKGGAGTTYDENHIDKEYAHIDAGAANPGYLTDIVEPYAVLTDNDDDITTDEGTTVKGKTLTFYYDTQKADREGMDVGPFSADASRKWHGQRTNITEVVFDDSFASCSTLTSTAQWFRSLKNLKSIKNIANLKTDNVTDMYGMFYGCSSLTSIDLSGFNTRNVTDMTVLFTDCSSLTSLDLGSLTTDNVTNMSFMFSGCSGITSLDLSGFNTEKVTIMWSMFDGCTGLTSLNVSNFNTTNVTNMSQMFKYCSNLTSIDVSGFNTENVTNMASMFYGCSKLTSLNLDSIKTNNVESMHQMFSGCSSISSLDISNFKTDSVKNMKYMFDNCSRLTSLDLTSFNTANVTDMYGMFSGCSGLTTIYVDNNWSTEAVTESSNMFIGCNSLVGGTGTVYDESHVDASYAHIDGGKSNPGYFTDIADKDKKEPEPYAVLTDNDDYVTTIVGDTVKGKTLTFYYDTNRGEDGMNIGPFHSKLSSPWDSENMSITKVVFDDSFANYNNLTSTYGWFSGCYNLSNITGIANLKTDSVTNMNIMFAGCSSLTSLDVSGFNTAKVKNIGFMFYKCSSLKSLDVSGFNTENVTDMSGMFEDCSSLTSLDVSGFNTAKVTEMYDMFYGCSGLTGLDVSGFNTANVTEMNEMFAYCSSLTTLDVSGFNTKNVTYMNSMFISCSNLKTLDLSNFNTAKVTDMERMFWGCSNLKTLDLSGFNTANVNRMSQMFHKCSNLTTIYASSEWNVENVTYDDDMFTACFALVGGAGTAYDNNHTEKEYAHIDGGVDNPGYFTDIADKDKKEPEPYAVLTDNDDEITTEDGTTIKGKTLTFYYDNQKEGRSGLSVGPFNYFNNRGWNAEKETITTVVFDNSFANYTTLTSTAYWFSGCTNLTSIINIHNLKTTNVTNMSNMFAGCSSLTSLDVSGFNTDNVTDMSNMFGGCSNLTSLDVSGFNTANATDMGAMFDGCSSLTTLDVSGFNTKNVTNMNSMFSGCSGLTRLDVSGFNTDNVTNMAGMFFGCYGLTSLDVSRFNTANATDMGAMFSGCSSLTTLDVSGFNTKNVTDMAGMFFGCYGLTSLDVSGFNTTNVTGMGYLFAGCYGLTSLDVSRFNTDNVTNMASMFYGCSGLTSLDVSRFNTANATDMRAMFAYCSSLTTLDVSGFNTKNVIDMNSMFEGCYILTTIYAGKDWNIDNLTIGTYIFQDCKALVGGAGTKYDAGHIDVTYAHIDGGKTNPGYFTDKNAPLVTATYENYVLTVVGQTTMAQALEQVGGSGEIAKDIAAIIWNSTETITKSDIEDFGNPNLLIYVQTDSLAPEGVNNVIIDGKAKNIVLVDAEGNSNFYAPQEFTADSISYTRIFKQATQDSISRGWEGICLPFNVQTFTHEKHGDISPFGNNACNYHFWLRQPTSEGVISALSIEANKPYIISMPNSDEYEEEFNHPGLLRFTSANVTVPATEVESVWLGDSAQIVPTFQTIEASPNIYALNVGHSIMNYPEGSIFVSNYREVRPFEVYTFHESRGNEGAGSRIISLSSLFGGKNNSTSIVDVMKTAEPNGETWYDMNGRRLQSKPSRKGVYIMNGKKVVVK